MSSIPRLLLNLTSSAGFGALALGVTGRSLPAPWIVTGLGVHAALCTLGVLVPSLDVWTTSLSRATPGRRRIALTFDDGPHPRTTREVLARLDEHRMRATFFVLGEKAERHPEVVREAARSGHEIGLHGYTHDRLYALRSVRHLRADIARGLDAVERASGVRPTLFRAPVGFVSHTIALSAEREGLVVVGHTLRALDGRRTTDPGAVLSRVTRGMTDGAVILLHDAAERDGHEPAILGVLSDLLIAIRERGLATATVSELFELAATGDALSR